MNYVQSTIITSGFFPFSADGVRSELHIFHHSCALKEDEGPCKAIKDRFYFNIDKGRCESFEYGGCQGNANNFETLEECEQMCVVRGKAIHVMFTLLMPFKANTERESTNKKTGNV